MVEFIELLFITSLWIWGVNGFFELTKFEILFRGYEGIPPKIPMPLWLQKPLFGCPPCMGSIHGTFAFILFHHDLNIWLWPIFCFCLCGLNYIIKEHLYA